jgi:hypothetical protein
MQLGFPTTLDAFRHRSFYKSTQEMNATCANSLTKLPVLHSLLNGSGFA